MSQITVGSLFSGIGGLELGLERAGMRVVWQVEREPYCLKVLAQHWPNVTRHTDVCKVGAHNLEPVDVICGGFPCQDVSQAGRQAGVVAGTRSGLWYEYSRIVRELRPRYVVVENVAALLVRGLDVVLGELAESGYDAEWDCIPASAVGAPHQRDRIFITAYAREVRQHTGRAGQSLQGIGVEGSPRMADADRERRAQLPRAAEPVGTELGRAKRSRQAFKRYRAGCSQWSSEPDVGRVAYGVPARVDRIAALGNAVVPQVAEYIGRLIVEADREALSA